MKKKKENRGLAFRITTEYLNMIFDLLKKRAYKLVPKDVHIHVIGSEYLTWNSYTIVMTSKEFPIVEEGQKCPFGTIRVDSKKKIIELKEAEKEGE